MILIIDHYDSFTYNLYQMIGEVGEAVQVIRYDQYRLEEIHHWNPKAIILSPGPGSPAEIPPTIELIKSCYRTIPILGICLGHQAIGFTFGARITRAKEIRHGKTSNITHNGQLLFSYLTQPLEVMRYHSLVIERNTLPSDFEVMAQSMEDDEIMSIKHRNFPLYGIQFHPESIGTPFGKQLIINFLKELEEESINETVSSTFGK
jgi:anthranilate synthase component II